MIRWILTVFCFILVTNVSFGLGKVNQRLLDHAIACPKISSANIPSLVLYLKKASNSDAQTVELFCYWIAENIAYDTKGYLSGKYPSTDETLFLKRGVCNNYAVLLQNMCTSAGIECHVVNGYSKGYSYVKNSTFSKTDHAWNIVKVRGKYTFIDATWASGYASNKSGTMTFYKRLDINEIFADSNYFATKHLPADPRWQLRNRPISITGFSQNDSIKDMMKSTRSFYHFNDSINAFMKADSIHRIVITAESAYNFNPITSTMSEVARAYYRFAWYNSNHFNDQSHFELAINWYTKAIIFYEKLNNDFGKNWIASSQKSITYCRYKLKELDKPFK